MGFILKQLFSMVKLLNSETGHNQIAAGIAAGFVLGMTPAFSLQTILIFLSLFLFRIQIGMAFLSAFFFAFIAWVLDPIFHSIGLAILESESFLPLFTWMYNLPLVPFTRFNNSVVMGSGVLSILLFPFVFIGSRALVLKYRVEVLERFKNTKFWRAVKATAFYKWYYSYDKIYG
ncbi:MAG: TIGR03546 family protein [Oligoflexia bacterium]|nr:TIGR03546 family protein [Oligoflexia bacterium]